MYGHSMRGRYFVSTADVFVEHLCRKKCLLDFFGLTVVDGSLRVCWLVLRKHRKIENIMQAAFFSGCKKLSTFLALNT